MRPRIVYLCLLICAILFSTSCHHKPRESGLRIVYGANGIERLTFNGVLLEDLAQHPNDAFHIWHIKSTALNGKPITDRQYGWGEVNNGRHFDPATHAWLYSFVWGSVRVQFAQHANTLDMHVVETNNSDSSITLEGLAIYPFVLRFPNLPSDFGDPSYEHLAVNPNDPVPVADFGEGQVSVVVDAGAKPLYHGFEPAGGGNNYFPVIASTPMDSISAAYPRIDRPVAPGASDSFTVSLRFANSEQGAQ